MSEPPGAPAAAGADHLVWGRQAATSGRLRRAALPQARQARIPPHLAPSGPPSHRRTLTFCSSADAASGTSADMVLLLQKRRREGTDYRVARPPAAFCLPSCPPGWRLSPCDDTAPRLPPAVAPAAQARQTPAPRPYLPIYPRASGPATPKHFLFPSKVEARASPHFRP